MALPVSLTHTESREQNFIMGGDLGTVRMTQYLLFQRIYGVCEILCSTVRCAGFYVHVYVYGFFCVWFLY